MLGKEYRIPQDKIPNVARRGKKSHVKIDDVELITISKWFDNELEHPRFAFIVSKKIDKRAVVRNRIKRRLRAIIYHIMQQQTLKLGDYSLFVKSSTVADMDFEELKKSIERVI